MERTDGPDEEPDPLRVRRAGVGRPIDDTDDKCSWNFEGNAGGCIGRAFGTCGRGESGGGCRGDPCAPCMRR